LTAQTLTKDSPELVQAQAMGYDISADLSNNDYTVISAGDGNILLNKTDSFLFVSTLFTGPKTLNEKAELEVLRLINQANNDLSYQVILTEEHSLVIGLYSFGPYQPKTFAQLIRLIENANVVFRRYPRLVELMK